jgi:hypothetical protein
MESRVGAMSRCFAEANSRIFVEKYGLNMKNSISPYSGRLGKVAKNSNIRTDIAAKRRS